MRLLVALVIFFITPEFNGQAKSIEDLNSEYGLPIVITEQEKKETELLVFITTYLLIGLQLILIL